MSWIDDLEAKAKAARGLAAGWYDAECVETFLAVDMPEFEVMAKAVAAFIAAAKPAAMLELIRRFRAMEAALQAIDDIQAHADEGVTQTWLTPDQIYCQALDAIEKQGRKALAEARAPWPLEEK